MYMSGGYHGSIMHILEYADYFLKRGDEVSIGSVFISDDIGDEAKKQGIHLYNITDIPMEPVYDLVYAFHIFLFPYLLSQDLNYKNAIATVLSPFAPLEKLPPSPLWRHFDLITCISDEIIETYRALGIDSKTFVKIPNHIPLDFLNHGGCRNKWNEKIGAVCVVSNHYVPELAEMAKIAPWRTDFFGNKHNNNVKITPQILNDYDVVITIGKTVQYALGLGIPVFEYDIHGGCGYIGIKNMLFEEKTNFSGRGTGAKLSCEELCSRIAEGYPAAVAKAASLCEVARERYSIARLIEYQLSLLPAKAEARKDPVSLDTILFCNASAVALKFIYSLKDEIKN